MLTVTAFTDNTHVTGDISVAFPSSAVGAGWKLAVKAVAGLGHLEAKTVAVLTDGAVHTVRTVASGTITLDSWAGLVEAGLPFTSRLVTLRPESRDGQTIQGTTMSRSDIIVRVLDTITVKVNGVTLPDRSTDDFMDAPPPLFSGDLPVPNVGWGTEGGQVTVEQDLPIPATIVAVAGYVYVGDE